MVLSAAIENSEPETALKLVLGLTNLERQLKTLDRLGVNEVYMLGPSEEAEKYKNKHRLKLRISKIRPLEDELEADIYLKSHWQYEPDCLEFCLAQKVEMPEFNRTDFLPGWVVDLSGNNFAAKKKEAEQALFGNIRRKTEGWIAPNFNKPLSFAMTRWLVLTKLSPNMITLLTLVLAFVSLGCIAWGDSIMVALGGLGLHGASILDGCDGEVARLKVLSSTLGAWLDTLADDIINHGLILALTVHLARVQPENYIWPVGLVVLAFSLAISAYLIGSLWHKHKSADMKDFQPAWQKKSTADLKAKYQRQKPQTVFDWVRPLMKRDFFLFFVAILLVLYKVFWVWVLMVIAVTVTFFVYLASFIQDLKLQKAR